MSGARSSSATNVGGGGAAAAAVAVVAGSDIPILLYLSMTNGGVVFPAPHAEMRWWRKKGPTISNRNILF